MTEYNLVRTWDCHDKEANPISIRLGTDLKKRLWHLAALKGTSYQILFKAFVLEGVHEEANRLG
jgi:hypothetical protein